MTDIFSDFIECFHSPLDYVKGINTTGAVRSVFIYTLCDPFGTIAGYNPLMLDSCSGVSYL